ncbi:MAG TPA: 5-formyltetrahydrofolate cyclo-ligase [Persephonella sp.]|uniref:5-formyltetrahydrofolate cyclo-ligase n=1 Tax=Persephonella marina (strain DSM 14350 / EX-H1) TaxID=123214 RepID=C0QT53_PERMH|nr:MULTISPECIES: 5-formyltetrahydrofolate cyclo-ligase [Persephonella]ACO04174.1 5-formyltetrahydrofolate cyclo-ligase [Persephonella marina EX-H1]HCB70513.1 5-formyltetrahydrofolate cyclo-ligase [Persephonella sp.]
MKQRVREELLQKRRRYEKAEEDALKIKDRFLQLEEVQRANSILLYYPHKNEVNTLPIIEELLKTKKVVLLPKVKDHDIIPIQISDLSGLKRGYAGILEPEGEAFPVEDIDIVVVPAVAYDLRGHRLGYGKGYYDRLLKRIKGLKVGLAYDFQVVEKLPVESHDVPVDLIITPTRTINTKGGM